MNVNRHNSIIKKYYSWVPDEWDLKPVENVSLSAFTNGVFNDPKKVGKGCKLINVVDLYSEPYIKTEGLARLEVNDRELDRFKVIFGDLFFTRSSLKLEGIAHCNINVNSQEDLVYDCHIMRLRPDTKQINPFFLRFFCVSYPARKFLMSHSRTTTMTTISQEDMRGFRVPLPPLPEQKKIAEILGVWDEVIEKVERLIAAKRKLKKALMQQLLTGKKRFKKYKNEKWKTKKIGEMLGYERPDKYIVESTDYTDNGAIPVLTANKSFVLGFTNEVKGIYEDIPVIIFDDFTTDSKYVDFPFKVKSSAIKLLKEKSNDIKLKYLFELMQIIRFPLGNHKRYYISEYQHLNLKVPRFGEQQNIVSILNAADKEIELLNKKLDALKQQKKGLMQKLLTGKIRVKVRKGKKQ